MKTKEKPFFTELQKTIIAYPKSEKEYMLKLGKMTKVDLILYLNNLNNLNNLKNKRK